jgi:hypothetical protein
MLNEQENDAEREKDRQQQFKNIDGDLIKLLDYLNMEVSDVNIDGPEDWGDLEEIEEESNKFTDINISGKKKKIPLLKIPDDEENGDAKNLALAPEEEEQLFGEEVQINLEFDLFFEGASDASASASETDANRAAYLKQYGAKPEQRKRRSARTNARNKLIRQGRASVGDGKDLDHKDGNPMNNAPSNLRLISPKLNRSRDNNKWRKNTNEEHGAGEVGTKKLLKKYLEDTPYMSINGKFADEL